MALGANDPRAHRNLDEQAATDRRYGPTLGTDKRGRLGVVPAARQKRATSPSTAFSGVEGETTESAHARLVTSHNALMNDHQTLLRAHNELIAGLERGGFLGGAR